MTIDDDEIRIDNLETKLTIAHTNLGRLLKAIKARERRESFGVINADRKKELIEAAQQVANRIGELEIELEQAINAAGRPYRVMEADEPAHPPLAAHALPSIVRRSRRLSLGHPWLPRAEPLVFS